MTPTEIKAAREAIAKATPGPWTADVWIETDGNGWRATGPHHEDQSHDHGSEPGCPDEQAAQTDAAFIALARQALPDALEEIERLRALVEEACDLADMAANHLTPIYRSEFYRRDGARIAAIRGAWKENQ